MSKITNDQIDEEIINEEIIKDQEQGVKMDIGEILEDIKPKKIKKEKIKKPRKPMTESHRLKLLEALKKARVASALKRGKASRAKKILKEKNDENVDKILDDHIKAKKDKEDEKDKTILELKAKLDGLTLQDIIPKIKKKKIEKIVEDDDDIEVEIIPEIKKVEIKKIEIKKVEPIKSILKKKKVVTFMPRRKPNN